MLALKAFAILFFVKYLLVSILLTLSSVLSAQMVLQYDIVTPGTQIAIPLAGPVGTVNVIVDWGDGSAVESFNSMGDKTHNYTNIGIKTVTITGSLTAYGSVTNTTGNARLTKVVSWDGLGITNFFCAFRKASLLTQVPSSLPPNVTNLVNMFSEALVFNQPIGNWDVSKVTNMGSMFYSAKLFNQPIGNWDVSKVTNMENMFSNALVFNQPIGNWNTSAVTNMSNMFVATSAFNQPIGNWDVSKVVNMLSMFYRTKAFNQPIGNWNTSSVVNMNSMFSEALVFNQPIGDWDVSRVKSMNSMFSNAVVFNKPIANWNTSAVMDFNGMFYNALAFNQPIGDWDTRNVTSMSIMFNGASVFNQSIGKWDVSKVTEMAFMFAQATAFNQPLETWNTSAVIYMSGMFSGATSYNMSLGEWNISAVTYMDNMFQDVKLCTEIYDKTLIGWASQLVKTGVPFHGGLSKYSQASAAARATLISKGWTITDGGLDTDGSGFCARPPLKWNNVTLNCAETNFSQEIKSTSDFPSDVTGLETEIKYNPALMTPKGVVVKEGLTSYGKVNFTFVENDLKTPLVLQGAAGLSNINGVVRKTVASWNWGDAGAWIDKPIKDGDYITFQASPLTSSVGIGFASVEIDYQRNSMPNCLWLTSTGDIHVYENGANRRWNLAKFTDNATIKIERKGDKINYYVNGVQLSYSSPINANAAPFIVDFTLLNQGGGFENFVYSGDIKKEGKLNVIAYLENAPTSTFFSKDKVLFAIDWELNKSLSTGVDYPLQMTKAKVSYPVGFETIELPLDSKVTLSNGNIGSIALRTWNQESLIQNAALEYNNTIVNGLTQCATVVITQSPNDKGDIFIDLNNTSIENISITRNIVGDQNTNSSSCAIVNGVINSSDVALVIGILNGSIVPNKAQLIAADVNLDGAITAADATLISSRAINQYGCEFPQSNNYNKNGTPKATYVPSKDWLFVAKPTLDNASFGTQNILSIPNCLPIPSSCSSPKDVYYSIMLGDVNQDWKSNHGKSGLRTSEGSYFATLGFNQVQIQENGDRWVPLILSTTEYTYGIDIALDTTKLSTYSVEKVNGFNTIWNISGGHVLAQLMDMNGLPNDVPVMYFNLGKSTTEVTQESLDASLKVYLNGDLQAARALGTNELESTQSLSVYPNPARDNLQINWSSKMSEQVMYKIYNTSGVLVYEQSESLNNDFASNINIANLNKGAYVLKITTSKDSIAKSFIKE